MSALVVFELAEQLYGLPIDAVAEIIPVIAVERVPQMPRDWYGMANIRGMVTPVIDLRLHLRLSAITPALDAPLIVMRRDGRQLAILVDKIVQILYQTQDASVELYNGDLVVALEPATIFAKTPDIAERRN